MGAPEKSGALFLFQRSRLPPALIRLLSIAGSRRLAVTALCLVTWRALEQIPVASLNPLFIGSRLLALEPSTFLHAIGSAAPFASYSLAALGLQPYVMALITIVLIRVVSKSVQTIAKTPEGELRLRRWARGLTVLLAMGQAYGWTVLYQVDSFLPPMDWSARLVIILQLTGGTMILVFLGDVLDEFGLGFGNGAILIYALSPLAVEMHRLADILAASPSLEALYRPLGVWIIFSIGLVVASVAALLAVRRIPPEEGEETTAKKPVEFRGLLSGALRPPLFANAIVFVPVILANYLERTNPGAVVWVSEHVTAYGPNPWTDVAYAIIKVSLVIAFTYFVVGSEFDGIYWQELADRFNRFVFIGGTFLALAVVVVPILEWYASLEAGRGIGLSGFDAVLVVAMIVFIVRSLEQSRELTNAPRILTGQLP